MSLPLILASDCNAMKLMCLETCYSICDYANRIYNYSITTELLIQYCMIKLRKKKGIVILNFVIVRRKWIFRRAPPFTRSRSNTILSHFIDFLNYSLYVQTCSNWRVVWLKNFCLLWTKSIVRCNLDDVAPCVREFAFAHIYTHGSQKLSLIFYLSPVLPHCVSSWLAVLTPSKWDCALKRHGENVYTTHDSGSK